jgi:small subunit ribosomal protein S6
MVSEELLAEEDKALCGYELVLIISPEVADEKMGTTIDGITQFITGKGGVIADVEQLGKRKLAYPIKQFMEGNYLLIRFQLEPKLTKEFEANLQISEEVLRHLLIKLSN